MKHLLWLGLLMFAPRAQDPRARLEELQKKIALLGGEELKIETDPAALAASLGHDLGKMFAFTRSLPLHPYAGALRGAAGTLLAGAANDADRCLLLKAMIESGPAGPAVRFAFGELTDDQVAALAARALRAVPGQPVLRKVKREDILARVGQTEASLAAARGRTAQAAGEHLKRFDGGFGADRAAIDAALAGAVPTGSDADGMPVAAKALRSHVWLQVQRDGAWVDLDPSFPEAAAAWAPVAAARTGDSLPGDLQHRIALKLVVERREGNKLVPETIYAGGRALSDLAGRAINLSILPSGYDAEKSSQPLSKQAAGFTKYQPVIDFGDAKENARVFDVQGRVFQSKNGKFGGDFGDAAGERVIGAFARKPKTDLAAVRLEVEVSAPGKAAHTERRYLLDRLKPGTRESGKPDWEAGWDDDVRFRLALFQSWTIWPAPGMLNDSFLFERFARVLARDGGVPRMIFDLKDAKNAPKPGQVAERIDPLPLGVVQVWQSALQLAQGAFPTGEGACFPATGSILAWKETLAVDEKGGIRWRGGIDLLHAPLGCVAKNPAIAARARLLFGLLLSEGESALMESRPGTVFSAAVVCRKAREAKIPLVALRGKIEGISLSGRPAALVQEELKAGRIVLIPKEPVTIGGRATTAWWRIDPVTGACLGIGDTGEGQGTSEGVLILDNISIPMVQRCMKFVVCLNMGIGAGRSMQDAGRECMTEFMRDYIKDTVDGAIDHFIKTPLKEKAQGAIEGGVGFADPELSKMYEQAKETWGTANEAIDDLTFSGLRAKVAILLDMGNEIARYAHEKSQEGR